MYIYSNVFNTVANLAYFVSKFILYLSLVTPLMVIPPSVFENKILQIMCRVDRDNTRNIVTPELV